MKPAVLMTDPRHFAIRGGANPHTRHADNSLKVVDIANAWPQWHAYVDALLAAGVDVYVVDAQPGATGMVFAANAGFLPRRLDDCPSYEKAFYVSHFTAAHRAVEEPLFARFMADFGFDVRDYPPEWRFEGEADAFPIGRGSDLRWVFTHGFRSDPDIHAWLEGEVLKAPVAMLRLTNPAYYHGDTLLFDLGGPAGIWHEGLDEASGARANELFAERLLVLGDEDARAFVGNSFYVETAHGRHLFTPSGIPRETRERIEALGVRVCPVDISEFFGKGGGGPKCMVFNLGRVDLHEPGLAPQAREFRRQRHVLTLRDSGHFPA